MRREFWICLNAGVGLIVISLIGHILAAWYDYAAMKEEFPLAYSFISGDIRPYIYFFLALILGHIVHEYAWKRYTS